MENSNCDLTEAEEKQMMTLGSPAKVQVVEPEPIKVKLLKFLLLGNLVEKDGKNSKNVVFGLYHGSRWKRTYCFWQKTPMRGLWRNLKLENWLLGTFASSDQRLIHLYNVNI